MEFCREQQIKAVRKPRRCMWCGESIAVGEPAVRRAYCWDGEFQSDILHPECIAALNAVDADDYLDGFPPHEFARGREDDRRDSPPEFGPDGKRIPGVEGVKA